MECAWWTKRKISSNNRLTNSKWSAWVIAGWMIVVIILVLAICLAVKYHFEKKCFFGTYLFTILKLTTPPPGDDYTHEWIIYFVMGICATLLVPFLTAAINNWVQLKTKKAIEGRVVYPGIREHYVLVGYNHLAPHIIANLLTDNDCHAITLTEKDPVVIRAELRNLLPKKMADRVILYAGSGLVYDQIKKLNINEVKELYLLDESEPHGSKYMQNLAVLKNIALNATHRAEHNPLVVYMQVNSSKTYNLLQRVETPNELLSYNGEKIIDLRPFNFYENWARLLWSYHKLSQYDTLDFEPLENTDKHVHLVISSFNSMGRALFVEALRLCHYPNFVSANKEKGTPARNKTIISVFDKRWNEMKDYFLSWYPHLDDSIDDIQIDYYSESIDSPTARKRISDWAVDENKLLTIAICEKDSDTAMSQALNLPEEVFYQSGKFKHSQKDKDGQLISPAINSCRTRVLIRQSSSIVLEELFSPSSELVAKFHLEKNATYPNIQLFGMLNRGISDSQLDDDLAMCINGIYSEKSKEGKDLNIFNYEDIRACMDKIAEMCSEEKKMSDWKKKWMELSEDHKWSNRFQSDMYKLYIDTLDRTREESQEAMKCLLAEVEHRRWIAERVTSGWRQKDENEFRVNERHIHHLMIPYDELPKEERTKDTNVIATAKLLVQESKRLKQVL